MRRAGLLLASMVIEVLLEYSKSTTCDHCAMVVLTPPLTPLSAQHTETAGNLEQKNRLR